MMMTINAVKEGEIDLSDLIDLMDTKGVSQLSFDGLTIKMKDDDQKSSSYSLEDAAAFEKMSKMPSDKELLFNPMAGLQIDDTEEQK